MATTVDVPPRLVAFADLTNVTVEDFLVLAEAAGLTTSSGTHTVATPVAPTVTAASAYTSGDVVGGLITFPGAARTGVGSGVIPSASLVFKSTQIAAFRLFLFRASPSGSTFTDKTAPTFVAADAPKRIGVVEFIDPYQQLGTGSEYVGDNLPLGFELASGIDMYGVLIVEGTPTFGTTSDLAITLGIMQD